MLTHLLSKLAPWLANSWVITGIVAALILWSSVSFVWLLQASRRLKAEFDNAEQAASNRPEATFAADYETFSASISRQPLIGPRWRGYRETLIVREEPAPSVIATADLRAWFDLAAMFRQAGTDLRYHAALPGLLVGSGLMFTFLGLAAALTAASDVVAVGVTQDTRTAALRTLLGTASVKFITSLAGLFLSIVYALLRKSRLKVVEQAFGRFATALQHRTPFRTAAWLQAEANLLLQKQNADIQRIGTDFFVNLGSTLERTFNSGLDQHIGPLAEAVDKLTAGLATQNQDAMDGMMRAFLERLEGAVGENMRGTAETLNALSERLDGLQAGIDAAARRMSSAAEEMATGMGRGAETALSGITEQMALLVRSLRDASEEAARGNRAAGDDLVARMADTSAALASAAASFQQRLEAGAAEGVGRLAGPIEALLAQLHELSTTQRNAGAEAATALAATVARSADTLEATAANIAGVLGGGAADASARLIAATEAMRDDLRAVLDRFGVTLGESGRALTAGAEAGGERLRAAAESFGGDLATAAGRLREAGDAAGAALREGGAAAQASLGQSATALAGGSAALAERLAALGAAAASLAERTAALDQATRAVQAPLVAAAADLRTAAQSAQVTSAPLREAAAAVVASIDGLAGAAAALGVSQRAAEQLASRLVEASDRFAGLDDGLARTLRALGEGLGGYQDSIAKFVNGVDAGFERSVQDLKAIVQGLEDTVQDLMGK